MRIPRPSSIPAKQVNYFSAWRALAVASLIFCFSGLTAAQTPTPQTGGQKPAPNQAQTAAPNANQQATSAPQQSAEEEDFLLRRARWFYQQRAYPLGFIPPNARLNALKEMDAMIEYERKIGLLPPEGAAAPVFPGPNPGWGPIGPSPENNTSGNGFFGTPTDSGRVAAIAVDPTNPSIVYVGGAQGGIWKSTDAGAHFTVLTDSQPSLAVGSIAIAPSSPSTIYVGTGEQDFVSIDPTTGGENYYGAGVLVSTDGGNTWTQRAGPFMGPFNNQIGGARIPAITVHPTNSSIVLAGVVFSSSGGADAGIYRSTDAGATWTQVVSGAIGTAVVFNPSDGNTVYAALGRSSGGSNNGVYKSTDGGMTFTKLGGGLPTTNVGRIELAIAASAPNTIYASIADSSKGSNTLLGLFRTTDGGTNWTQMVNGSTFDYCGPQCFYSHAITVSPVNSSLVIAGGTAGAGPGTTIGQTVFRSMDGGMTWTDIHVGASNTRLHSDQHAFRFSADGSKLYVGNDGGAWRTDNPTAAAGTLDWANLNGTLTLAQFYPGLGVDASNGNAALGGTQDNGTIKYSGSLVWDQVGCGDGAWNIVDNQVPSTVYALCTSGNSPYINKSLFAGAVNTFFGIMSGINLADRIEFIPAIALDPNNNQILYTPTHRVYQTTNGGASWTPISPDLTMDGVSSVAVVAVAKSDSNTVYASTDDARIWRTINALSGAGAMWTNLNTPDLPNRFITRIAIDRTNRDIVYLTYSGFKFPPGDTKGHVFKSTNGGTTWVDISGTGAGALPNVPVNDIVVDPDLANALYIGTDIGVFQTLDGGTTWTTLGTGLPRVAVHSLTGRRESRVLYAATHGRGVWIFQLTNVAVPAGPFLASISPSTQAAGSPTFMLTADGDHFLNPSSKVQWDGSQTSVTTTFVSVNQLTATIDTSLLTAGVHQVSVFDATQTPTTSSSLRFAVTNPAPSITPPLSPSGATAGGPGFTLTVTGSGFNCSGGSTGSVVNFGTTAHNPATCTPTQLTAAIAMSEIAASGPVSVTVFTPAPGGGNSNVVVFVVTGPPPSNDAFSGAIAASPLPFTKTEDTTGATTDTGGPDPTPACAPVGAANSGKAKSVWFSFTTPASGGTVVADTFLTDLNNNSYNTILSVWTGSPGVGFTPQACNDDARGDTLQSRVVFTATGGTTYFFMVTDANGFGGNLVFHLNFTNAAPLNDNFANAIAATTAFTDTQDTSLATNEPSDPAIPASCDTGQSPNFKSIWYKFVTPAGGGTITADTNGSLFDDILSAWTGGPPGAFTAVPGACSDVTPLPGIAGSSGGETITFTATAGVTYFFMVSDFDGVGGTSVFHLSFAPTGAAPALSFNPTSVNFGSQRVGTSSAVMTATVTNTGNATLTLSTINLTGANTGDFPGATPAAGDCTNGTNLAPNASCNLRGAFAPTATGPRSAAVTITDNAAGSPHSLPLSGTGIASAVTFSPTSVAFGNQAVGTSSAATHVHVTNSGTATLNITSITLTGTNPGEFSLTSAADGATPACPLGASALNAGNACNVDAKFGPTSTGAKSANISVADDASGSPQTVSLSGTGTGATGTLSLNPTSANFGNQRVGTTSAAMQSVLSNAGPASVTITNIQIGGTNPGDFAGATPPVAGDCGTSTVLTGSSPGNSCNLRGTFTPTATGARSATLTITATNSTNSPVLNLSGTGIAPAVTLAPTNVNFGNQRKGTTSAAQNGTLTNSGTDVLHLTAAPSITGANAADFTIVGGGTTCANGTALNAGQNCTWSVTFTPSTTGAESASLTFADDATGSPHSVALTGTGTFPVATPAPTNVNFGNQRQGTTSAAQNGTLTNSGTDVLHLTAAPAITGANAGDFAVVGGGTTCANGTALSAGQNCTWSVTFTPSATGARNASLTFTTDVGAVNVPLTGTGTLPGIAFVPTSVNFGNQAVGSTSAATHVHATNSGTATLNISGITLTGTNASEFSLTSAADGATPACPLGASALSAGNTCNVDAKFGPTSTGAKSANISVADDAAGSPQTVPLSGTGVAPDLTIVKAHSGNFTVGINAAFTITVSNVGTAPSSAQITVSDTLPAGLGFISGTGTGWACSAVGQAMTCTNPGPIANGSNSVITLAVSVGSGALPSVMNTAMVSGGGDINPNNNSSTDTVMVSPTPAPDLTITKSHTGNFTLGTNGTYTLTVSNVGTLATSGTITVQDTLPVGLGFVSATGAGWTCGVVGQVVTCTNPGPIANGSNSVITLVVSVSAAAVPSVTNTATVGGGGDTNPNNNSSSDPTTVNAPDLTITKSHTGNFTVGVNGTYTLTVRNSGTVPTTAQISVTDTLPAGLGFVSATGTGWTCNFATGTVTCTNPGPLAASASSPITLTVSVAGAAVPSVTNNVTVSGGGEVNTSNDSASDPTTVTVPDLTIAKSHTGNFTVGINGTYTITVTNSGTAPTTAQISVTDTLPAGLGFVSATGTGWTCNFATGTVTCTNPGPLANGANSVITLVVSVAGAALPSVTNTVTVSGGGEVNTSNDSASDPTTVTAPDLTIAKSHTGNFFAGTNNSYTITVTNSGTAPSSGTITMTDTLPAGLGFVSAAGTGWTCNFASGKVTCTNPGPLAANANSPITLTVSVAVAAAPSVTNMVTVSGGGEVNTSNDSASDPTTVIASDLSIVKSHTGSFTVGVNGTYTLTVSNGGPTASSGTITVTDTLPNGLGFVSGTGTGWTCNATGQAVTCTNPGPLAANANSAITLTVSVGTAALGTPTNSATVAVANGDTVPGNNTSNDPTTVNNPTPTLTSISPTAGNVGQAISMTLTGTGFNSTSTVNFGATPFAGGTASADGMTLTINIPGTALGATGTQNVSVSNKAPCVGGICASGTKPFTISDFSVSSPTGEQTVAAGGSAQFTIAVGTQGGTLANDVTFAASNLPPATTATFNPMSFAKGSNGGSSTLTLQTTGRGAVPPQAAPRPPQPRVVLWLVAGMLALLSLMLMRRGVRMRRLAFYLPLALLVLSAAIIAGCRGGVSGTTAGMYSVTVTATSGGVAKTTTVTIQVN